MARIDPRSQKVAGVRSLGELTPHIPSELQEKMPNWRGYPDNARDPMERAIDLLVPLPMFDYGYAVLPNGAVYSLWNGRTPAGEFEFRRCRVYEQRRASGTTGLTVSIRNVMTGKRTFASYPRMIANGKSIALRGLPLPARAEITFSVDPVKGGCYADTIQLPPIPGSRPNDNDKFLPAENPFA